MAASTGERPTPGGPLGALRRLVFALLPLALLLVVTELALAWLGLGGAPAGAGLGHGFEVEPPALVRTGAGWRTAIMDHPAREVSIAPKGEARRVLLFGGSNTQILPESTLSLLLNRDDPAGRPWEVVNLGREGYGSGRVALLLEQALVLEPDAVVLYCGHNEFVELGFRRELEAARGEGPLATLTALLGRLRLVRLLVADDADDDGPDWTAVGGTLGAAPAVDPASVVMPYAETLAVLDEYRAHLEAMVVACEAVGVPVLLCTPVSNQFSPPFVERPADSLSPADAERYDALHKQGLGFLPPRFRKGLRPPLRLRLGTWFAGDPAAPAGPVPSLRPLSGPLAQSLAPAHGDPKASSVAGAHWPDPARWGPEARALVEAMGSLHARQLEGDEPGRLARAVERLEAAVALAPGAAYAWFDLGLARYLLGDDVGARLAFLTAERVDRAPRKATPVVHEHVRALAAAHAGATLLDSAALFAERCPGGLTGYELLMDRCHLQPGARHVLMADVAAALLAMPVR